jgi:23S rRNA (uracil747-C5)-methyltransferase
MDCHHFDAGRCRSCALLELPYELQVARKQERCALALAPYGDDVRWELPVTSAERGFRNKAKMVVGGSLEDPALGILGPDGVDDLQDCGIHEPAVREALPVLAAFVSRARLAPYDVRTRRGELKYVLVTASPDARLMVRFVCRSQEPVSRIRKHLPSLRAALPGLVVATVNLQPAHAAVIEGPQEIVLTDDSTLPMTVNDVELQLRPRSFFQTNTPVAAALYRAAHDLVEDLEVRTVWDLYCGVGGFALHLAVPGSRVIGVETSTEAVGSARAAAQRTGVPAEFIAADATAWACAQETAADLVVVNPPRRGIGAVLAGWLDLSGARHVVYSSCNPASLAADLSSMPGFRPVRAQVFDMFPHTDHVEVLTLLERR